MTPNTLNGNTHEKKKEIIMRGKKETSSISSLRKGPIEPEKEK